MKIAFSGNENPMHKSLLFYQILNFRCAACPLLPGFSTYRNMKQHVVDEHKVHESCEPAIRETIILPRNGLLAWFCQVCQSQVKMEFNV